MPRRIAASMALVAFAVCILVGLQAGNTFGTILSKALLALVGTFVLGLVIGLMAQKMLDENVAGPPLQTNPPDSPSDRTAADR